MASMIRANRSWAISRHVKLLWRRWYYSSWRLGERAAEVARQDMRTFYQGANRFLWESGCNYWLAYGTLLGYRRDGDLILGDQDLDFGLMDDAYFRLISQADRLPKGFRLVDTSARHGGPKLCLESGLLDADLYFYSRRPLGLHLNLDDWLYCDKLPMPEYLVQPTQEVEFLGQPTRVPLEIDEHLQKIYRYTGSDARQDRHTGFYHRKK